MFSNLIYLLYFAGFQCCAACLHQNKTGGVSLKIWPSANMFALVFKVELLKVSKFQNEIIKSSHCPKYERKI